MHGCSAALLAAFLLGAAPAPRSAVLAEDSSVAPTLTMDIYGSVVDTAGVAVPQGTVQALLGGQSDGSIAIAPAGYFGSAGGGGQLLVAGTPDQGGEAVTFAVDGTPAMASPPVVWQGGGTAAGVILTVILPLVTGLSADGGSAGTTVRISGSGFVAATGVLFGTRQATFVVASDTEIDATVPPGRGTVDVSVATPAGASVPDHAARFTYVSSAAGGAEGGPGGVGNPGGGGAGTATGGAGSAGGGASPVPPTQPSSGSVSGAGGTLATADGAFTLAVPAGSIAGTGTLGVSESCAPPSGIPADTTAASCVFTVFGDPLAAPQAVTMTYDPEDLGSLPAGRLSVYRQRANGTWSFVPTSVDAPAGSVSAYVPGPETLAVLADTQTFPDIPAACWAASSIDTVVAASLADGFLDGTFRPEAPLTRAQLAKLVALTFGLPVRGGTNPFADVSSRSWFAPYVAATVRAGIVRGVTATTFDPGAAATREQVALALARALRLSGGGARLAFTDAQEIAPWAVRAVREAAAAGLLVGFPDGSFRPLAPTSRADAAEVFARVVRRLAPPTSPAAPDGPGAAPPSP